MLALSGGIGGAKLGVGLDRVLPSGSLSIACNTGDDFVHLGLSISPDLDTVLYSLAGIANPATGWGRDGDTWTFMASLADLGGDTWFKLGDADLALHVERTRRQSLGETLSDITDTIRQRLGVDSEIIPMSNQPVRTWVETANGTLAFQEYFVKLRCQPIVTGFRFEGIDSAYPAPRLVELLSGDRLRAIIFCPSNPFISIDPILAVPGICQLLRDNRAPVIAVSPIINGLAVKGPTAKMMSELSLPINSASIVDHYGDLIDAIVIDHSDDTKLPEQGPTCFRTAILMQSDLDKQRLAAQVLTYADSI